MKTNACYELSVVAFVKCVQMSWYFISSISFICLFFGEKLGVEYFGGQKNGHCSAKE